MNWSQELDLHKLAWQDWNNLPAATDPQSLVGWVISFESLRVETADNTRYKFISDVVNDTLYGPQSVKSLEELVFNDEEVGLRLDDSIVNIKALYKVNSPLDKQAWKDVPEDLTGWLVHLTLSQKGSEIINSVDKPYCVVLRDLGNSFRGVWGETVEKALRAYKEWVHDPEWYLMYNPKEFYNITPLLNADEAIKKTIAKQAWKDIPVERLDKWVIHWENKSSGNQGYKYVTGIDWTGAGNIALIGPASMPSLSELQDLLREIDSQEKLQRHSYVLVAIDDIVIHPLYSLTLELDKLGWQEVQNLKGWLVKAIDNTTGDSWLVKVNDHFPTYVFGPSLDVTNLQDFSIEEQRTLLYNYYYFKRFYFEDYQLIPMVKLQDTLPISRGVTESSLTALSWKEVTDYSNWVVKAVQKTTGETYLVDVRYQKEETKSIYGYAINITSIANSSLEEMLDILTQEGEVNDFLLELYDIYPLFQLDKNSTLEKNSSTDQLVNKGGIDNWTGTESFITTSIPFLYDTKLKKFYWGSKGEIHQDILFDNEGNIESSGTYPTKRYIPGRISRGRKYLFLSTKVDMHSNIIVDLCYDLYSKGKISENTEVLNSDSLEALTVSDIVHLNTSRLGWQLIDTNNPLNFKGWLVKVKGSDLLYRTYRDMRQFTREKDYLYAVINQIFPYDFKRGSFTEEYYALYLSGLSLSIRETIQLYDAGVTQRWPNTLFIESLSSLTPVRQVFAAEKLSWKVISDYRGWLVYTDAFIKANGEMATMYAVVRDTKGDYIVNSWWSPTPEGAISAYKTDRSSKAKVLLGNVTPIKQLYDIGTAKLSWKVNKQAQRIAALPLGSILNNLNQQPELQESLGWYKSGGCYTAATGMGKFLEQQGKEVKYWYANDSRGNGVHAFIESEGQYYDISGQHATKEDVLSSGDYATEGEVTFEQVRYEDVINEHANSEEATTDFIKTYLEGHSSQVTAWQEWDSVPSYDDPESWVGWLVKDTGAYDDYLAQLPFAVVMKADEGGELAYTDWTHTVEEAERLKYSKYYSPSDMVDIANLIPVRRVFDPKNKTACKTVAWKDWESMPTPDNPKSYVGWIVKDLADYTDTPEESFNRLPYSCVLGITGLGELLYSKWCADIEEVRENWEHFFQTGTEAHRAMSGMTAPIVKIQNLLPVQNLSSLDSKLSWQEVTTYVDWLVKLVHKGSGMEGVMAVYDENATTLIGFMEDIDYLEKDTVKETQRAIQIVENEYYNRSNKDFITYHDMSIDKQYYDIIPLRKLERPIESLSWHEVEDYTGWIAKLTHKETKRELIAVIISDSGEYFYIISSEEILTKEGYSEYINFLERRYLIQPDIMWFVDPFESRVLKQDYEVTTLIKEIVPPAENTQVREEENTLHSESWQNSVEDLSGWVVILTTKEGHFQRVMAVYHDSYTDNYPFLNGITEDIEANASSEEVQEVIDFVTSEYFKHYSADKDYFSNWYTEVSKNNYTATLVKKLAEPARPFKREAWKDVTNYEGWIVKLIDKRDSTEYVMAVSAEEDLVLIGHAVSLASVDFEKDLQKAIDLVEKEYLTALMHRYYDNNYHAAYLNTVVTNHYYVILLKKITDAEFFNDKLDSQERTSFQKEAWNIPALNASNIWNSLESSLFWETAPVEFEDYSGMYFNELPPSVQDKFIEYLNTAEAKEILDFLHVPLVKEAWILKEDLRGKIVKSPRAAELGQPCYAKLITITDWKQAQNNQFSLMPGYDNISLDTEVAITTTWFNSVEEVLNVRRYLHMSGRVIPFKELVFVDSMDKEAWKELSAPEDYIGWLVKLNKEALPKSWESQSSEVYAVITDILKVADNYQISAYVGRNEVDAIESVYAEGQPVINFQSQSLKELTLLKKVFTKDDLRNKIGWLIEDDLDDSINNVVLDTMDAYSAPRYGKYLWEKAALLFQSWGLNFMEIEEVLRSKFMRTIADDAGLLGEVYIDISRDDLDKYWEKLEASFNTYKREIILSAKQWILADRRFRRQHGITTPSYNSRNKR